MNRFFLFPPDAKNSPECSEMVGSGTFGLIYECSYNGTAYVAKMLKEKTQAFGIDRIQYSVLREVSALLLLEGHPNIVKLEGMFYRNDFPVMVMERAQMDLNYAIDEKHIGGNNLTSRRICRDIFRGVAYMHLHKLVHRDIKAANILIFPGNVAKVADFGATKILPADSGDTAEICTWDHRPPENFIGQPYSYSGDVWALGVVSLALFFGDTQLLSARSEKAQLKVFMRLLACDDNPWPWSEMDEEWKEVKREKMPPKERIKRRKKTRGTISSQNWAFTVKCLALNPSERPTCDASLALLGETCHPRFLTRRTYARHDTINFLDWSDRLRGLFVVADTLNIENTVIFSAVLLFRTCLAVVSGIDAEDLNAIGVACLLCSVVYTAGSGSRDAIEAFAASEHKNRLLTYVDLILWSCGQWIAVPSCWHLLIEHNAENIPDHRLMREVEQNTSGFVDPVELFDQMKKIIKIKHFD